ncbi:MAG: AraC family ligand binding domain-containing protein, partial [Spirochaetia bacterium]|nr:AraC family ligand binding domain-containing protein [Spirochaetia bacterium]
MARSPILHFTRDLLPVPGFETIGRRQLTEARPGFEKDVHPGSLEICHLASGRQTLAVGGEIFSLRGGDVFVTQPGEVHSTGGAPREKCLLYWVRLNAGKGHSPFLNASPDEAESLKGGLLGLPRRFRGNQALQQHLEAVLVQFRTRGPFWKSRAAQHLLSFAIETVLSAKQDPLRKQHPGIQKVLGYLEKNVSENPGLGELAAFAGLSTGRFSSQLREAT